MNAPHLTAAEVDALEKLEKAATPGEWVASNNPEADGEPLELPSPWGYVYAADAAYPDVPQTGKPVFQCYRLTDDLRFAAESRNLTPGLIALVREAMGLLGQHVDWYIGTDEDRPASWEVATALLRAWREEGRG